MSNFKHMCILYMYAHVYIYSINDGVLTITDIKFQSTHNSSLVLFQDKNSC